MRETTFASSTPLRAKPLLLRPITDIQPFYDYSPTGGDPCEQRIPDCSGVKAHSLTIIQRMKRFPIAIAVVAALFVTAPSASRSAGRR